MKRLAVLLAVVVALLATSSAAFAQQFEFKLGFKALADQIPQIAGQPLEDEHWGPNGDSLQRTTTGLMVWRKADNWTAFTNGAETWLNGPGGLQTRPNGQRFCWEGDATRAQCAGRESSDLVDPVPAPPAPAPAPAPPAPTPVPTPAPAPPAPAPARSALNWAIDFPSEGQRVPAREFAVRGWVVDPAAEGQPWSGIDEFQVYADGERDRGGKRINVLGLDRIARPDVAQATGKPAFENSGFRLGVSVEGISQGAHVLYVYAHSSVSGWDYRTINLTLGPFFEEINLQSSDLPAGYRQIESGWDGNVHVSAYQTDQLNAGPAVVESELMAFRSAADARAFVETLNYNDAIYTPVNVMSASASKGFEVSAPLGEGSPWVGFKLVVFSVDNMVGFVAVAGHGDVSPIINAVGVADRIASRLAGKPAPAGPGFQMAAR